MPRPTIENIRGLSDFQTSYRWNLTATFPSAISSAPTPSELNLRCETTELPKATNQKIPINIRGHRVQQHGITEYQGSITFTFVETIDSMIKNLLRQWREAIWASKTGVSAGEKGTLQSTMIIQQLNNQDQATYEYTLIGCFLEDYDLGQLTGDGSDIQRPTMTLSYDYFTDREI